MCKNIRKETDTILVTEKSELNPKLGHCKKIGNENRSRAAGKSCRMIQLKLKTTV